MNYPEPTIRVNVDVANPGQFFACCGLLELADRLWPGAEGWFDDHVFLLSAGGSLRCLLERLIEFEPSAAPLIAGNVPVKPLIAPLEIRLSINGSQATTLLLDAWATVGFEKGAVIAKANPPWNFWSGQQTSARIWRSLRQELGCQLSQLRDDQLSDVFNATVCLSGRFGFDPGPAWNALDVGFSPNEHKHQGFDVASSPAVELLAAVGIQRFRPVVSPNRELIDYRFWSAPLSPLAAAAIVGGLDLPTTSRTWRCRVVSRVRYAALSRSFPLPGEHHVAQGTVGRLDS